MSSSPAEFSIAPQAARDPFRDRKPPWSEDAEQAVLGAMLLDADAIVRAVELVDETMFYREAHRRIFRAMLSLHQAGAVLDPLTLANELEKQGGLGAAGGKDYIGTLLDVVPTAANVEYHLRIVKEKALRRRLIEVAQGLVVEAHESGADAADLIDLAEHRIFQVSQQRGSDGFMRIKELLWPAMERIEQLREGGPLTGVATRLHRPRQDHARLPAVRPDHHRGAAVDGEDRVRAEHRAIRRGRGQFSDGDFLARNE